MTDVNQRALGLATRNADANDVKNVTILESDRYSAVTGDFGVIVTNPPVRAGKTIVTDIIAGADAHLSEGGQLLWCSRRNRVRHPH